MKSVLWYKFYIENYRENTQVERESIKMWSFLLGEANQTLVPIDHRLLLDYRMLNCIKDVDSKWEQMIYLWQGLTLM